MIPSQPSEMPTKIKDYVARNKNFDYLKARVNFIHKCYSLWPNELLSPKYEVDWQNGYVLLCLTKLYEEMNRFECNDDPRNVILRYMDDKVKCGGEPVLRQADIKKLSEKYKQSLSLVFYTCLFLLI